LLQRLPEGIPFHVVEEPNQLITNVLGALEKIFNGKSQKSYDFKIAMDQLSSYSRKVLNCTSLIPVGYVKSYGTIAKIIGGVARSVGARRGIKSCSFVDSLSQVGAF
jgi:O6-methylguanine-DNA--protein-cysteine methyltransferase